jgi:hypothetical protein
VNHWLVGVDRWFVSMGRRFVNLDHRLRGADRRLCDPGHRAIAAFIETRAPSFTRGALAAVTIPVRTTFVPRPAFPAVAGASFPFGAGRGFGFLLGRLMPGAFAALQLMNQDRNNVRGTESFIV